MTTGSVRFGSNRFDSRLSNHWRRKFTSTDKQFCFVVVSDVTGKYIKEGQEASSSEETQSEELQTKLWEISGRYTSLDGYEPLAPPPPPVEEESKPKEQEEKKAGEDTKPEETGEEKKGDEEEKKEEKDGEKPGEEKPKIEDCEKNAEETTKTVD